MVDGWKRKEVWHKYGDGFCVEVSHHTSLPISKEEGPHRWCVYAYIYPTHPHFEKFEGDKIYQDAATALPLHGGASLLHWHQDGKGKITSVQVGGDYNHDGDAKYTHCEDSADAYPVFRDAEELVTWLSGASV